MTMDASQRIARSRISEATMSPPSQELATLALYDVDSTSSWSESSSFNMDQWMDDIGDTDDETADRAQFSWVQNHAFLEVVATDVGGLLDVAPVRSGPVLASASLSSQESAVYVDSSSSEPSSFYMDQWLADGNAEVLPDELAGLAPGGLTDLDKSGTLYMRLKKAYEIRLSEEHPEMNIEKCNLLPLQGRKAAASGGNSGFAKHGRSLRDQVLLDRAQTLLLMHLGETTTTQDLIGELRQLGCAQFNFLRMPIENGRKVSRGFAIINYSTVEAAMRFITAAEGRIFAGASEKAVVYVAPVQGIVPNLDALKWNRRRKQTIYRCNKMGVENGAPLVWLGGKLRQILTEGDVEAARAVYG